MKRLQIPLLTILLAGALALGDLPVQAQRGDGGNRPSAQRPSGNRSQPQRSQPQRAQPQRTQPQRTQPQQTQPQRSQPPRVQSPTPQRPPSISRPQPSRPQGTPSFSPQRPSSTPGQASPRGDRPTPSPRPPVMRETPSRPPTMRETPSRPTPADRTPSARPETVRPTPGREHQTNRPLSPTPQQRNQAPRQPEAGRGPQRGGESTRPERSVTPESRERMQRNLEQFRQQNPDFRERIQRERENRSAPDQGNTRPGSPSERFRDRETPSRQSPEDIRNRLQERNPDVRAPRSPEERNSPRERGDADRDRDGRGGDRPRPDVDRPRPEGDRPRPDVDRPGPPSRDRDLPPGMPRPTPRGEGDRPGLDRRPDIDRRPDSRGPQDRDSRFTHNRPQFSRDRDNQSLQYLRLKNTDVLDRIAQGNINRDSFRRDHHYRIRPIYPDRQIHTRFHHRSPVNIHVHHHSIANRMIWWRGSHLAGYRYDPFRYRYRNYRGHVIGVYYWNVFQPHYRFIVPHYNQFYNGSFYCDAGRYYYYPQTFYTSQPVNVQAPPQQPVEMQYGDFDYSEDLAYRFERQINDLCLDMHYNYRENPNFDEAYQTAYDLLLNAKDILAAAQQNQQEEVASLLYGLDQLYYYLLDQVADWERTEQKPIGDHDLLTKFSLVEATMQHLMFDSGVEPSFEVVEDEEDSPSENAPGVQPMIDLPTLP